MWSRAAKFVLLVLLLSPLASWSDESLPIGTTSGKLKLNYQSEVRDNSRVYRVRNTAKGILTPVLWKYEKDIYLDVTLPRCPHENDPCDWVMSSMPSSSTVKRDTSLGYGVNQDEFTDKPEAFVKKPDDDDKKVSGKKMTTSLKGTIADADDNPVYVDVTVSSVVNKKDGGMAIHYQMSIGPKSTDLLLPGGERYDSRHLKLLWESPKSKEFDGRLKSLGVNILTSKKMLVEFAIPVKEVRVEEKTLKIMQGDKKIASVTAPAYVPGGER